MERRRVFATHRVISRHTRTASGMASAKTSPFGQAPADCLSNPQKAWMLNSITGDFPGHHASIVKIVHHFPVRLRVLSCGSRTSLGAGDDDVERIRANVCRTSGRQSRRLGDRSGRRLEPDSDRYFGESAPGQRESPRGHFASKSIGYRVVWDWRRANRSAGHHPLGGRSRRPGPVRHPAAREGATLLGRRYVARRSAREHSVAGRRGNHLPQRLRSGRAPRPLERGVPGERARRSEQRATVTERGVGWRGIERESNRRDRGRERRR
jgi:hypothetical protein